MATTSKEGSRRTNYPILTRGGVGQPVRLTVSTGLLVPTAGDALLALIGQIIAIVGLQRGIPSKRESSARVEYVTALCTHRPSLLPIEWSGEVFGSWQRGRFPARDVARSPLNLII
ncbi:hypothetical protein V6N13_022994 [Hibiscus sabdariffa]